MASQDMNVSITTLDDSLVQYILHFLCGPDENEASENAPLQNVTGDPIEDYVTTLLRVERVSKHFQRIMRDDKLWGYWSVLDGQHFKQDVYLSVPEYGPGIRDYDERFQNWRDLTMCKAAIARIRFVQNEYFPDEKLFGYDSESSISYMLAHAIFQFILSTELRLNYEARLELRMDSAAMLFTLVGEYVHDIFHWANMIEISANQKYSNGRSYPELDSTEMKLLKDAKDNDIPNDSITVEELNMNSDDDYKFDKFIRMVAYRAGIVKITNDAIDCAKHFYCNRLYLLLRHACLSIRNDVGVKTSQKRIISNIMDVYYVAPLCHVKVSERGRSVIFIPVPGQFESANIFYQRKGITNKVYGIENITKKLQGLEEYYSLEEDDNESSALQDDTMLGTLMSRLTIGVPSTRYDNDVNFESMPNKNDESTSDDDDEGYEDVDSGSSDDEWLPTIE
jgi:hypothetical protein